MLSTQQAEGYAPSGEGSGSVLEEYMDSLLVMPVEVRRYITLLRELDRKCHQELQQVREAQEKVLEEVKAATAGVASAAERGKIVKKMREEDSFKALVRLRLGLEQKIAEKRSVSDQLFDMSEQNLKRLNGDIKYLEDLFRATGEMPDLALEVGREVAAWMETDKVWILGRIVELGAHDRIVVADIEDSTSRFTLPTAHVAVLPESETLSAAKGRLPSRGRKVWAMYPDTTSFYKGTMVGTPHKESGSTSTGRGDRGAAGPPGRGHPPGTILCTVQFDDDMDQLTGQTPKHAIPAKHVFGC